jgi:hypothetical protein
MMKVLLAIIAAVSSYLIFLFATKAIVELIISV